MVRGFAMNRSPINQRRNHDEVVFGTLSLRRNALEVVMTSTCCWNRPIELGRKVPGPTVPVISTVSKKEALQMLENPFRTRSLSILFSINITYLSIV